MAPLQSFPPPSTSTWQNNIWSNNTSIRSFVKPRESPASRGLLSRKLEDGLNTESNSDSKDDFIPSGSSALAATSEVDGWSGRGAPWNSANGASNRNVSGNTSPNRTRGDIGDIASNAYYPITQPNSQRVLPGSSLASTVESSNGIYKFGPSFSAIDDDRDNGVSFSGNGEPEHTPSRFSTSRPSQDGSFLGTVGGGVRDTQLSSSIQSEDDLHSQGNSFGAFVGANHAQRPSISGQSASFHSQNPSRSYDGAIGAQVVEDDLPDRVGRMTLGGLNATQNFQFNPGSQPWENGQGHQAGYSRDSYQTAHPFEGRGSAVDHSSPAGSSYRVSGLNSPRTFANTPQSNLDVWSRPASQDHRGVGLDGTRRGFHEALGTQLGSQHTYFNNGFYSFQQFPGSGYEGPYTGARSPLPYSGYSLPVGQYSFSSGAAPPARPGRSQDPATSMRSLKLEEFKSSSRSSKRWELKDIFNHIVEFAGDQHGSRFIQNKLETANSDDKEQVFREIQPNLLALIKDLFGNYVVQKLFEHGNQAQKQAIAAAMKGQVAELSKQMYACRVVQKVRHVLHYHPE